MQAHIRKTPYGWMLEITVGPPNNREFFSESRHSTLPLAKTAAYMCGVQSNAITITRKVPKP